jgi:hypothetical protein
MLATGLREEIFGFLTDDGLVGDGTNQIINVDADPVAIPFWYLGAAGYDTKLTSLIWYIEDNVAFDLGKLGGIAAIATGILLRVKNAAGTITKDLLDGLSIKKNSDLVALSSPANWQYLAPAAGNMCLIISQNLGELDLKAGEKLELYLNSDIIAITRFQVAVRGYRIRKPIL